MLGPPRQQDTQNVTRPNFRIDRSSIKFNAETDKLGEGNFCVVYKATYSINSMQRITVAVKVNNQETEENHNEAQEAQKSMLNEARLMSNYQNSNVIDFFGVVCDSQPTWLVMEYCPGGSLYDHLCKNHEIPKLELTLYCFEVSKGMKYLHSMKCIHRDLATRNCLISAEGLIKISDFGLSKIFDDVQQNEDKIKHIPIRWMAPECITKPPTFLFASDIWSFGVLIYEVFNKGVAFWPGDSDYKAMGRRIRSLELPKFPEDTPNFIVRMVEEKLWLKSPEARSSFQDVMGVLKDYLFDNVSLFPPVQQLFLNKIKGVNRTQILRGTRLHDESVDSPATDKNIRALHVAPKKRHYSRAKSIGRELKTVGSNPSLSNVSSVSKDRTKTGRAKTTTSTGSFHQPSRQQKRKRYNRSLNSTGLSGE